MKKVFSIIVIFLFFFAIDNVYAESRKIYNVKAEIKYDENRKLLLVHETFLTRDGMSNLPYNKRKVNVLNNIRTNASNLTQREYYYDFDLEDNDEYYFDYEVECPNGYCTFYYQIIHDYYNNDVVEDINITILPTNGKLPNITFDSNNDGFLVRRYDDYIIAKTTGNEYHRALAFTINNKNNSNNITDENTLKKYDNQADLILGAVLCSYIGIIGLISAFIAYKYNKLKKKNKLNKNADNSTKLFYWESIKSKQFDTITTYIYFFISIMASIIMVIIYYAIVAYTIPYNKYQIEGLIVYSIVIMFVVLFTNVVLDTIYTNYKKEKLKYEINIGQLFIYDKDKVKVIETDKARYNEVIENINNEPKTFRGKHYKKDNKIFLLYINDKKYYLDYLEEE